MLLKYKFFFSSPILSVLETGVIGIKKLIRKIKKLYSSCSILSDPSYKYNRVQTVISDLEFQFYLVATLRYLLLRGSSVFIIVNLLVMQPTQREFSCLPPRGTFQKTNDSSSQYKKECSRSSDLIFMLFVALCVFLCFTSQLLLWLARCYFHIFFAFSLRFGLMRYRFVGESVLTFG